MTDSSAEAKIKTKDSIRGKRVTVIGAGISGRELALLAAREGAEVLVSEKKDISGDTRKLLEANGVKLESGGHTEKAFDVDIFLLSSGISPGSEAVQEAKRRGITPVGELDLVAPRLSGKIVGVTGSNGKSTVTALIGHMLNKAGWNVGVGGNLGTAASTFTDSGRGRAFDAVVLELSSFQLAWATVLSSFISIVTNLAPDHIDWHGSYENYVAAKAKILSLRAPDGWGIVQERDVEALGVRNSPRIITLSWDRAPKQKTAGHIFMGDDGARLTLEGPEGLEGFEGEDLPLFNYSDTSLLGVHNLENIAMSLAALHLLGVNRPAAELMEGFSPLPHRCENAGTVDGVLYVDDSKGTNVAASITAMTSITGRKVMILGGRGKGEDYAPLAEAAVREAEHAVLIGEEADAIEASLKDAGFAGIHRASSMDEAVKLAHDLAKPGMTVLLSPACTSWDMYDNYGQRGDHFCSLVKDLPRGV